MPIEHVSDTARWVAFYRAMESERSDAIFRDPYARRLAGPEGEAIVDGLKRGRQTAWAMIVRTALFDEIILAQVAAGADTVVNLAAGLDARPWRLALPASLRWVDVDLPAILAYKQATLGDARPACAYEAVPTDLTDAVARRALFQRLGAASRRALVVSEGLLLYLTPPQVAALAADLGDVPSFHAWLLDLASPSLLKLMQRTWGDTLARGNAPFRFAPDEGTDFFRPFGWREAQFRSIYEESHRLRREMPLGWLYRLLGRVSGARRREQARRMSAAVLLERA
jgi:methyltransferase (TIGR00027 family)